MYKRSLQLIVLIAVLLAVSGCTESDGSATNTNSQNNASIIYADNLSDINISLESGPVLVEIGSASCGACKSQKLIMEDIAAEYTGRASVIYIETSEVGSLGFSVTYVPDSFVVVGIENGTYVYMKSDGQTTTNREQARFLGLTRKEVLTQTLDHALEERSGADQA